MDDETRAAFARMERSFQLMQQEMRAGFERVERIEVAQKKWFERVARMERSFQLTQPELRAGFERLEHLTAAKRYRDATRPAGASAQRLHGLTATLALDR
jgi:hypothetical protein